MLYLVIFAIGIVVGFLGWPLISYHVDWICSRIRQVCWRIRQACRWIKQWYKDFARDFYVLITEYDWLWIVKQLLPLKYTAHYRVTGGTFMYSTWRMWFGCVLNLKTVKVEDCADTYTESK